MDYSACDISAIKKYCSRSVFSFFLFWLDTILGFLTLVTDFLATKLWLPLQDCGFPLALTSCQVFFFFSSFTCLPKPIFSVTHSFERSSALRSNWLVASLVQEEDSEIVDTPWSSPNPKLFRLWSLGSTGGFWEVIWKNFRLPWVHTNCFLQCCFISGPNLLFVCFCLGSWNNKTTNPYKEITLSLNLNPLLLQITV